MSIKSCCGAYCQLDGTISCCEHSDLRTKCWFYWKYQDGARRKQITRHEYYCPSCSNRLDDVRIAQQHTKTLQASSAGLKKIQHTHCTHDNNPKFEMSARHLHFCPPWLETQSMSVLLKAERMHKKLRKIRHGCKQARKPAFQYQAKLDEEAVVVVKVPKSCGCYCDFNRSREDCCCIHLLQKLQNSKKASKKNCDDHHVGMCHSDFCQQCRLRSILLDAHEEEPVPKFYPSAIRSKKKTTRLPTLGPVPLPTLFTVQEVLEEEQQLSTSTQDEDIFLESDAALQETVNSDVQGDDFVLLEWFSSAAERRSSTGTVFNLHSEVDFPPLPTTDTAMHKGNVFVPVTTDTHLSEPTASHDDDQEHEQWSQELVFVERNRDAYKLREESTPAVVVDDESAWEEISSDYSVLTVDTTKVLLVLRSSQGSCSGVVLPLASYRSALLKQRDVVLYSDEIVQATSTDATEKTQPNNLSSVQTNKEGKHHGSDESLDDDGDLSAFDDRDGYKYGRGGKPALWFRGNVCRRKGSKSKFCGNKTLNERRHRTPHRDREYYRMQKKE